MATTPYRHKRTSGVTLVEMLIVMAIVALIGGMAIPTLARLGAFSQNAKADGARELLNMLKAARVYAATFRVDTAVYYTIAEQENLVLEDGTEELVPVIDGFGLARGFTDEERREQEDRLGIAWGLSGLDLDAELDKVFFPVEGREGQLRLIPPGACLPDPRPIPEGLGMRAIRIYKDLDTDGDFFDEGPILPRAPALGYVDVDDFPAHIFRPTGQVDVAPAVPPRIVLEVSPSPEAPIDEQYVEYISPSDNDPVAPIGVELYAATGRAVIGS